VAFGLGFWRMEYHMRDHSDSAIALTAVQLSTVAVVSLVYCVSGISGPVPVPSDVAGWLSDPTILIALVWTGIVTTAFSVLLETLALKDLTATEVTLLFSTEPIWGAIFSFVVLGEVMGGWGIFGGGMILAACAWSSTSESVREGFTTAQCGHDFDDDLVDPPVFVSRPRNLAFSALFSRSLLSKDKR